MRALHIEATLTLFVIVLGASFIQEPFSGLVQHHLLILVSVAVALFAGRNSSGAPAGDPDRFTIYMMASVIALGALGAFIGYWNTADWPTYSGADGVLETFTVKRAENWPDLIVFIPTIFSFMALAGWAARRAGSTQPVPTSRRLFALVLLFFGFLLVDLAAGYLFWAEAAVVAPTDHTTRPLSVYSAPFDSISAPQSNSWLYFLALFMHALLAVAYVSHTRYERNPVGAPPVLNWLGAFLVTFSEFFVALLFFVAAALFLVNLAGMDVLPAVAVALICGLAFGFVALIIRFIRRFFGIASAVILGVFAFEYGREISAEVCASSLGAVCIFDPGPLADVAPFAPWLVLAVAVAMIAVVALVWAIPNRAVRIALLALVVVEAFFIAGAVLGRPGCPPETVRDPVSGECCPSVPEPVVDEPAGPDTGEPEAGDQEADPGFNITAAPWPAPRYWRCTDVGAFTSDPVIARCGPFPPEVCDVNCGNPERGRVFTVTGRTLNNALTASDCAPSRTIVVVGEASGDVAPGADAAALAEARARVLATAARSFCETNRRFQSNVIAVAIAPPSCASGDAGCNPVPPLAELTVLTGSGCPGRTTEIFLNRVAATLAGPAASADDVAALAARLIKVSGETRSAACSRSKPARPLPSPPSGQTAAVDAHCYRRP